MIKHRIQNHPIHGKCLFADNGIVEIGIPLDFGLRIGHFSFCGEKNVFFEQPSNMTEFITDEGWRLRGGHRLWIAPEGDYEYFPDNEPIGYEICDDKIILIQKEDLWLHIIKSFTITFENNSIKIVHKVTNTGTKPLNCSLWPISCVAGGGVEYINFERRDDGYDPWHKICMWDYTNLGDERAHYTRDGIVLTHLPIDQRYKIGVGHPFGPVRYENGDTVFIKHFKVNREGNYPDGNVSYEAYLNKYFAEMESLSELFEILPDESAEYEEILELKKCN